MKILFAASTYPHSGYPFSAFIKVICEEMTRQGHEVTVIAPQSISSILFKGTKKIPYDVVYKVATKRGEVSIRVFRPITFTFSVSMLNRLTWWSKQRAFCRTVKKHRIDFDVVYAHFWNNGYNALPVVKKTRKPLFVATGEDHIIAQNVLSVSSIKQIYELVRGVVCVSNKNKNESLNAGLTTENKCVVLPNAINPDFFYKKDKQECRRKLGFPQTDFIVVFCGRFNRRKGVDRVSSAIKLLNNPRIKSIFIGSYSGKTAVDPDCEGILFKGKLEQQEVVDYLNCADVFVLPSLAEGCSNAIIEAMACGLTIISSALPFNEDICNEENSILVDPMDIQAIANAIKKMMNVEFRKRLSEGAIKTAAGLNISERTSKILSFIEQKR